ncbi:hypothetical protein [Nocardia goodfellowii]|uniref:DUF4185 domain-containing protein n=1 Tax=Nocardia goodfellowii TaxID=882446 RepID=A0ABS4QMC1_9NOCA|nr:hypothetical protein [Nocardia goodfellowii]MBP2192703.1 hypothetical protein [Nocardia goodfellowii]
MLVPEDEMLSHQLPTTFDHVAQSDLRWTERVVMYGFDKSGEISIMTGLARYPNRNVMDAYAMVTIAGKEAKVVRLSTEYRTPRTRLGAWSVGPYTYEVIEPLLSTRATLAANEHGLSMQLELRGDFPAYEQTPAFHRERGRVREDARRYYQNGTVTGWIEIDGRRIEIDPDQWWFGRDHSWGVRHGPGGGSLGEGPGLQPTEVPDGVLYYMGIFQFDDQLVHFAQRETSTGERWQFEGEVLYPLTTGRDATPIIDVEHELTFEQDLRVATGGTFTVHAADRTTSLIEVRPQCRFWPGLAGYNEYRGYASGMWRGEGFSDGYTVDITDPAQVQPISLLSETLCEVRMGDRVGHGLLEMVFLGAYPRYGYTGW